LRSDELGFIRKGSRERLYRFRVRVLAHCDGGSAPHLYVLISERGDERGGSASLRRRPSA
jgi:hypothetical protein